MPAIIGALRAVLSLDSAAFQAGAKRAQASMSNLQRGLDEAARRMRRAGAGLSASVTAPIAALGTASIASARQLGALDNAARVAGVAVTRFKELSLASREFGIEQDKLSDILKDVNDKFGDYFQTGGGPLADFFDNIAPKVGLTQEAFKGLSSDQALQKYVSALREANVSQAEMTFYLEAIASDATLLLPVFDRQGAAIDRVSKRARALGLQLDESLIQKSKAAAADLAIVGDVLKTRFQAALAGLLPVFVDLVDAMTPAIAAVVSGLQYVADAFQGLSPSAQRMVGIATAVAAALGPVAVGLGLVTAALGVLVSPIGLVVATFAALAAGAVALYAKWDDLTERFPVLGKAAEVVGDVFRFVSDNARLLGSVLLQVTLPFAAMARTAVSVAVAIYENWDALRSRFSGVISAIQSIGRGLAGFFSAMWDRLKWQASAVFAGLQAVWNADFGGAIRYAVAAAEYYVAELAFVFGQIKDRIVARVTEALAGVRDKLVFFASDAVGYAGAIVEGIVQGFRELPQRLAGLAQEAWDAFIGGFNAASAADPSIGVDPGAQFAERYAIGIDSGQANVRDAARRLSQAAVDAGIVSAQANAQEIGAALVSGLVRSLNARASEAVAAAVDLAKSVSGGMRKFLRIQSPSKDTEEIGRYTAEGFVKGLRDNLDKVEDAARTLADTVKDAAGGFADDFGRIIGDGIFDGFEDLGPKLLDAVKRAFSDVVSFAISNPIKVAFGLAPQQGQGQGGGLQIPGLGGGASGAGGGGTGLLSKLFGGFGKSFSTGLQTALSGGFGNIFNVGGNIAKAVAAGAGKLGAALGALAPIVGIVGLAIAAFTKKTRELDRGLQVTIDNLDVLVESYRKVETSRFFGLSKSVKTSFDRLDQEAARPFLTAVNQMRSGIEAMAETVGVGAKAFENFSYQFKVSTKGLDQEAAQQAVENALKGAADALAERAFQGTENAVDFDLVNRLEQQKAALEKQRSVAEAEVREKGSSEDKAGDASRDIASRIARATGQFVSQIKAIQGDIDQLLAGRSIYIRDSETASEALSRLSEAITVTNRQMEFMERALFDVSIAGADMASQLVDLFGGIENFTTATSGFLANFYSEAELAGLRTRDLQRQFADLNLRLPETRDQYRALVEAQDLTTERGRTLYAALLLNAEAFASITPQVEALSDSLNSALGDFGTALDKQVQASFAAAQASRQAADRWYRTADSLRDLMGDLRGTGLGGASAESQFAFNRRAFEDAARAARGGDAGAAAAIPALARAFLGSAEITAATGAEFRAISAQVSNTVELLAGVAKLEGATEESLAGLYDQQGQLLQALGVLKELQGATAEQLAALGGDFGALLTDFDGTVGSVKKDLRALGQAIRAAEDFSYSALEERLQVAVDLIPTADIPKGLRKLLQSETGEISRDLDFIVRRNDLTAPQLYVAANAISGHIKNVSMILRRNDIRGATARLALATSSDLRRRVRIIAGSNNLPADIKTLALTASSALIRTVGATLGDVDGRAARLALRNVGDLTIAVGAAANLAEIDAVSSRLALTGVGTYTAAIEAGLNRSKFNPVQSRILLDQQGDYTARLRAILSPGGLTQKLRKQLLEGSTAGIRALTIRATFGDRLSTEERRLLREAETFASRTITAGVEFGVLSPEQQLFLGRLGATLDPIYRTLSADVAVTDPHGALPLLDRILGASDGKITLSGGILLDPALTFADALADGVASPLAALRPALDGVRQAILADLDDRMRRDEIARAELVRQQEIAKIEALLPDLRARQAETLASVQASFDAIRALEAQFGAKVYRDGPGGDFSNAIYEILDSGKIVVQAKDFEAPSNLIQAFEDGLVEIERALFGPKYGADDLGTYDKANRILGRIEGLEARLADLQNLDVASVAGFAPSEITSRAGGGGFDLVEMTEALAEMNGNGAESNDLLKELVRVHRLTARALERIEANGIPEVT